jgi:mRNA-degrading endonuclease RelE of RelBE toxin-antitoxin system
MEEKKEKIEKIEVNEVYKTHVGDIVKIIEIDKPNDRLHLFNISDGANQWVSLSRALEHKLKIRIK